VHTLVFGYKSDKLDSVKENFTVSAVNMWFVAQNFLYRKNRV
jgi:hypothetical protein